MHGLKIQGSGFGVFEAFGLGLGVLGSGFRDSGARAGRFNIRKFGIQGLG